MMACFSRMPLTVQKAVIEMVEQKQHEAFDMCLIRYGFPDDVSARHTVWNEIATEIHGFETGVCANFPKTNATVVADNSIPNKEKCDVQNVPNLSRCNHSLEWIPEESETPVMEPSKVKNERTPMDENAVETNKQKWYCRLMRWKNTHDAIMSHKKTCGKKTAVSDCIVCEKSESYVIGLKPPANELLCFVRDNNDNCRSYQRRQHQEKEEEIFICV